MIGEEKPMGLDGWHEKELPPGESSCLNCGEVLRQYGDGYGHLRGWCKERCLHETLPAGPHAWSWFDLPEFTRLMITAENGCLGFAYSFCPGRAIARDKYLSKVEELKPQLDRWQEEWLRLNPGSEIG